MKEVKLCQIVAVEKDVKQKTATLAQSFKQICDQPDLFSGLFKNYVPRSEDGERFPPQSQALRMRWHEMVAELFRALSEEIDVEATKDYGNAMAAADVVVEGQVLIPAAPVPLLLYLEKLIEAIRALLDLLPVRDESIEWQDGGDCQRSLEIPTHKTKKVQKPIVLYAATAEHPAQTQLITEDEVIGHWKTVYLSGAISIKEKKEMLANLGVLSQAVKFAREEANSTKVERKTKIAKEFLSFVLSRQAQGES